jgi:hypothetical protein
MAKREACQGDGGTDLSREKKVRNIPFSGDTAFSAPLIILFNS